MAKLYTVTLTETVTFTVEVEAESEEEAKQTAVEMWCQSEDPETDFGGVGSGVEVDDCEPEDEPEADVE